MNYEGDKGSISVSARNGKKALVYQGLFLHFLFNYQINYQFKMRLICLKGWTELESVHGKGLSYECQHNTSVHRASSKTVACCSRRDTEAFAGQCLVWRLPT
jgi:hypothetical protein